MHYISPCDQPQTYRHASMALQAEALAKLSLDDPAGSLDSLISMHNGILNALKLADATQGRVSKDFPSAAHQFQHITGCKRSEASYYLNHVPNNDIRAAVIVWHSQVLKDYLAKYQLPVSACIHYFGPATTHGSCLTHCIRPCWQRYIYHATSAVNRDSARPWQAHHDTLQNQSCPFVCAAAAVAVQPTVAWHLVRAAIISTIV